ncbi:TetR family transcriptional regulator [Williamsia limnetica]|uniref:TetR family transcriptional regulator n=1 Tax=Williamsia limnetica TaxID=882452 RepID=A0A318RQQ0_WILLI|nr:TetR/AcrR family transcriptional regulator [Williamsia limnetica]PYE20263.1 TetR family transcriptional regulator [Williamsia limnetica]
MVRPRLHTDEQLLDAADAVLARVGSARFTLELAAQEAGVSAPTLVKRFGSKRAVLIASSQRWVDSIEVDPPVDARESALDALRRLSVGSYADSDQIEHAAGHVSSLAMDLGDPELTRLLALGWERKRQQLAGAISRVIDAGELPRTLEATAAARTLFALLEGTFLAWTVAPDGSLTKILDDEFDRLTTTWKRGTP